MALPIAYRLLHEWKVGTKPDWGAAYYLNEFAWLLGLPVLCGVLGMIRVERGRPEPLTNSGWLPLGWASLWLGGTVVHLYSLGYVYDFELRRVLVAPALWALCWTLWLRASNWFADSPTVLKRALIAAPFLATFLALTPGTPTWPHGLLVALNLCAYGVLAFSGVHGRAPFQLLLLSALLLAWVVPVEAGHKLVSGFSQAKALGLAVAIYALGWSACSRNPKLGLLGAGVTAVLVGCAVPQNHDLVHWAAHAGLGFLLVHSLRWVDEASPGAGPVRILSAAVWALHGAIWVWSGGPALWAAIIPILMLCAYLLAWLLARRWFHLVIPLSAMAILLVAPGKWAALHVTEAPVGFAAIAGSFVLFAFGTLAALTRQRWHR